MASKLKTSATSQRTKRGRPPAPKPSPEDLRKAVETECWQQLRPIVIEGNCNGRPPDQAQTAFVGLLGSLQPNKNLWAALQARRELGGAYRQLCATIDAYARVRDLLHPEAFSEAEDFARLFGVEPPPQGIGGFTLRHMLKMQPHLDALLTEKELMATVMAHEPLNSPPDTARARLLTHFYAEGEGWRDALRIGRLMTWRELAMVSVLAGQWPEVDEGHVSVARVIRAEKKALRSQAMRMGIPQGSLPDGRNDLWGYADFSHTHFSPRDARVTPSKRRELAA